MKRDGLYIARKSAFLFSDEVNRRLISKVDVKEGFLLLCEDEYYYFADPRYFYAVKPLIENQGGKAVLLLGLDAVKKVIKGKGIKTLYIDYNKVTMAEFEDWQSFGAKIKDGRQILRLSRSVKNEYELNSIKKACQINEKAFYNCIKYLKKGITEKQFKDILVKEFISLGAEKEGFDTIVAFGANSAVPHHVTGDTVLNDNMAVLVDTGCVVNGFTSDFTRTMFFGKPSQKFIDDYNAVLDANKTAIENIEVAMSGKEADKIARDVLKESGLDGYFTHSLGHGIGLEIHEAPRLSSRSDDYLMEGQVFTIEPGVYFDGEYGIRIEDSVLLTENGVLRLFDDEKKLLIL